MILEKNASQFLRRLVNVINSLLQKRVLILYTDSLDPSNLHIPSNPRSSSDAIGSSDLLGTFDRSDHSDLMRGKPVMGGSVSRWNQDSL